MGQEPEEIDSRKGEKTEEPDYSKEIDGIKSDIGGLRTDLKDLSKRFDELAEEKGVEETLSRCPECYSLVRPEDMGISTYRMSSSQRSGRSWSPRSERS